MKNKLENEFIRKLEAYFDKQFNDYTKNRIIMYLEEYRNEIPPVIITQKTNIDIDSIPFTKNLSGKDVATFELLTKEANEMCKFYDVTLSDFLNVKRHKAPTKIVGMRKMFCKKITEKYACSVYDLVDFLNVDRTSVLYYLYGKNKLPKTKKTINKINA